MNDKMLLSASNNMSHLLVLLKLAGYLLDEMSVTNYIDNPGSSESGDLNDIAKAIDVEDKMCSQYTKLTHKLIKKTDNIIDSKNDYSNTIDPN